MGVEGVKRTNTEVQREIIKPKVEPKKTELTNTDNRNTVVGNQTNQGNQVKFKLNALFDSTKAVPTQQTPPKIDPVKKADELIAAQGGKDNLNEDKAVEIGKQIADISKTDPEGGAAVMTEVQKRLADTNYGDNAASGFTNNLSDTELQSVAKATGGTEMLRGLQDRLLSGRTHQNEYNEATRIGNAILATNGVFADNGKGIGPVQANYVSPYDPNATPEEAASFLKYDTLMSQDAKSQAFADALELHKNDPAWQKNFLNAVGTEKSAEYISGIYHQQYGNKDVVNRQSNTIRTTLEGMVQRGDLTQEGMNQLVDELKDRSPYVMSEIFGKSSDSKFREMFVRSAVANGDDRLDAAASMVLSKMDTGFQSSFLNELKGKDQLNKFIEGAMVGQQEVIELNHQLDNPYGDWSSAPKTKIGGVERLLQTAGIQTGYNGGSTLQQAPFSRELQQSLFYAAAKGLTNSKAAENFKSDVGFKDALSTVFLHNFDDIFKNSISPNGASLTGETKWLGSFFENVMFSQPPGTKASDVLATVYSKVAGIAKATDLIRRGKQPLTAEEQKLVDDYKTASPLGANWETGQAGRVIGEWLGNFDRAYTNAVDKIKGDAAANKATLDLFVGAVDKLTGLADLTPGANIAKDLLVDQLKNLPGYVEGKQVEDGTAKIEDSAQLITDLNNLIWDTIYYEDQNSYASGFRNVAGHEPTESGVK